MGKQLTDSEKTEVVNLIEDGISVADVAEHMSVSTNTIYGILRKNKVSTKRAATLVDTVDQEQLIQDYNDLYPLRVIAEKHQISTSQIYYILRSNNIPARSKSGLMTEIRAERLDTAVRMYQDGFYIHEITAETGIHQPTLHQELHNRKVPLRRPRGRMSPEELTERVRSRMERVDDVIDRQAGDDS